MQIVLNHVTRMTTQSRICVAGIEPRSAVHVRPITPRSHLLTRSLLRENGGPFGPGALVDLGDARHDPHPPESEDHWIDRDAVRRIRDLGDDEYWDLLDRASVGSVRAAFGEVMEEIRPGKFAVPRGRGSRSLGVVDLDRAELHIRFDNLYLHADVDDREARLRVTDVRFYEPDHETVKRDVVSDVSDRLRDGEPLLTMVGLARAMPDPQSGRDLHWLQINGLCLQGKAASDVP
jgi:hypothetical protein